MNHLKYKLLKLLLHIKTLISRNTVYGFKQNEWLENHHVFQVDHECKIIILIIK